MDYTNENSFKEFEISLNNYKNILFAERKIQESNESILNNYIEKLESHIQTNSSDDTASVVFQDAQSTYEYVVQNLIHLDDLEAILNNSTQSINEDSFKQHSFEYLQRYQLIQQNNQIINIFLTNILEFVDLNFSDEVNDVKENQPNTISSKNENDTISIDKNEQNNECKSTIFDILEENTLIINEKDNKCYLPFIKSEVENIFNQNSKFKSLDSVIKKLYTKNLNYYKSPSIARFKECFKLVKEKSNGGFFEALKLAIDNMFNYRLNPTIITACKNIDELEIYLDCLEKDQLYDFKCFNVKFIVSPTIKIT